MSVIGNIVQGLIAPVTGLISEYIEDKDKAAELAYKVSTLAATQSHEIALAQIEVNKAEAASGSLWNGGWRPAAGWTCVLALFNNYVMVPYIAPFFLQGFGYEMPVLDLAIMLPVLLGMLGLGTMRTIEKRDGVATK